MKYIAPKVFENSFTCPHCGVLAKQEWWWKNWNNSSGPEKKSHPLRIGTCQHCKLNTVWVEERLQYPESGNAPFPIPEMPDIVLKLYQEAASIHSKSPRGAAALLRLSIQHLCIELGEKGKDINKDIGELVKKGLPVIVQKALDSVRVIGNDAVHPGQIDTDDSEIVEKLFELVNLIVEYMISLPVRVEKTYSELPKQKLDGIENRDKNQT